MDEFEIQILNTIMEKSGESLLDILLWIEAGWNNPGAGEYRVNTNPNFIKLVTGARKILEQYN